ncbi:50S ribosomal protein L24 [uncultured archaeon]|nr:50S ribosomal protein L24 [uncultured archaeon]
MAEVKSSKPKRQRKWHYSKPLHLRRADFSAHLSRELRKQLGRRAVELRKGDKVKVMRGSENYSGKQGKVTGFKMLKRQVFIEGITRKKVSGKEIQVPFKASNLLVMEI